MIQEYNSRIIYCIKGCLYIQLYIPQLTNSLISIQKAYKRFELLNNFFLL